MKKILPLIFLSLMSSLYTIAQIPAGGYRLVGTPVNTDGWQFSPNITTAPVAGSSDDEIIMVQAQNQTGIINYSERKKLFFCDTTIVEFDFKVDPNASGTSDGFAFWILTNKGATPSLSPGLGIPANSTGHVVAFDFFDNDNNSNNPLIATRTLNNSNYVEGQNAGLDATSLNMPLGQWNQVRMIYSFNGTSATATALNLQIFVNNISVWNGAVTNTILNTQVDFGFSASNGVNASKLSLRNINILPQPLPPEIIVPTFCSGQISLPFVYPSGGNVVWYDSLDDETPSLQAPVVNTAEPDTFIYYFGMRKGLPTGGYCFGDRQAVEVVVHQSPIVDFSYSISEGCGIDTLSFVNLSDLNTTDRFHWDLGDGTDTMAFNVVHKYGGDGTYTVILKGENQYCSDTARRVITLENPFKVEFEINVDSICQNGFVEILNTSAVSDKNNIPTKWKWDFGVAAWDTLLTKDPPNKYYYEPGEYTISLYATNGLPCTDSFKKVVFVDPLPELNFTRKDSSICQGDAIKISGAVSEIGLLSITWDFGDGSTGYTDVTEITKAYDLPGTYTITATADYRVCRDTTFTKQILVKPIPNVNLPKDTSLCYLEAGFEIADVYNASNPDAKFLWSTGDTTPTLSITAPGEYSVKVNVNGCVSQDDITVTKNCYINIPNAFSPDGDGVNDYFLPRSSEMQNIGKFKMQIFNRYGQVIFETDKIDGKGWDGRYNNIEQPFGVYLYTIDVEYKNGHKEVYSGNLTLVR